MNLLFKDKVFFSENTLKEDWKKQSSTAGTPPPDRRRPRGSAVEIREQTARKLFSDDWIPPPTTPRTPGMKEPRMSINMASSFRG
jgi:hypothetical protein